MGQIQNAINNVAMTVAGGAIAKDVKTQTETLKSQLAVSEKNASDYKEYMESNAELIEDLLNPVVNRNDKKGESAVKMSQQQTKAKSKQNKNKRQRFEIKKGKLRGV